MCVKYVWTIVVVYLCISGCDMRIHYDWGILFNNCVLYWHRLCSDSGTIIDIVLCCIGRSGIDGTVDYGTAFVCRLEYRVEPAYLTTCIGRLGCIDLSRYVKRYSRFVVDVRATGEHSETPQLYLCSWMCLTRSTIGLSYHRMAKHHLIDGIPWLTNYPVLFESNCPSVNIIVICPWATGLFIRFRVYIVLELRSEVRSLGPAYLDFSKSNFK